MIHFIHSPRLKFYKLFCIEASILNKLGWQFDYFYDDINFITAVLYLELWLAMPVKLTETKFVNVYVKSLCNLISSMELCSRINWVIQRLINSDKLALIDECTYHHATWFCGFSCQKVYWISKYHANFLYFSYTWLIISPLLCSFFFWLISVNGDSFPTALDFAYGKNKTLRVL